MKSLIVYYSMHGNSELVAEAISRVTGADILRIEPEKEYPDKGAKKFIWGGKSAVMGETPKLKPYSFDADKYDSIILGFPNWASRPAPPIKSFVKEQKEKLKDKKISVFCCQAGNGAEKAFEKLKKDLEIDSFKAELVLIDPKLKKENFDEVKVKEFCERSYT